ncbi:DUF397 domain-containing protein [Streptomyces alkaliterrae]|uniref:DUF397 domain-containing protein n=1 Tax=Streptomyces alkaliterrae TaxID=2213162 RepID=A0A5P0YKX0_9ACTN|nr:DUF397 domain-containing protein [Streptomyces alkaliterrae]MBB1251865.1 DUF397 domain-containing protein [Streptomyces alkaliterrae]MBB1259324.1 DUF397 domain-containing protein [Streptomyces alkaliterrae]MQS00297.1 DUF397 domain-containing protein [Streptomyces alkaliterrae]
MTPSRPLVWVKSSYSGNGGAACVECTPGTAPTGAIHVRDSKQENGPTLRLSVAAFASLVEFIKHDG